MSQNPESAPQQPVTSQRRDRLRPAELLVFSSVLGVFAGLIVLLTTRDILLGLIFLAIGFVVSIVMVTLVGLGGKSRSESSLTGK